MRLTGNQGTTKRMVWIGVVFVISAILSGVSPAAGSSGSMAPFPSQVERVLEHRTLMRKVMSVVEHRTKDEKVLEKMRGKIPEMSDRNLHLAGSLCERIVRADDSAGADIAFSIVMTLVVLS